MKKRVDESGDYRVCADYYVAPTLENLLGIRLKDLGRVRGFLDRMEVNGLHLMPGGSTRGW